MERGQLAEAAQAFQAAYQEAVSTEQPGRQALSLTPWVGVLAALGRLDEAEGRAREALKLVMGLQGAEHPDVAVARANLAQVLEVQGRPADAEQLLRDSVEALSTSDEPQTWRVGLETLGQFFLRHGRLEEALGLWQQLEEASPPESAEQARALHTLAHLADALQRPELADAARARCLAILEPLWGATSVPLGDLLENMADSLASQARYDVASELYERAYAIFVPAVHPSQPRMHGLLSRWFACLLEQRRFSEARALGEQLEGHLAKAYGSRHPERGKALNELGLLDFLEGRHEAARDRFRQALDETEPNEGDPRLSLRYNLASALQGHGELAEAEAIYRELLVESPGGELTERVERNLAELPNRQEQD